MTLALTHVLTAPSRQDVIDVYEDVRESRFLSGWRGAVMALVAFLGGFGGALMGGAIVNAFQGDYLAAAVGGGIGLVVLATVLAIINWGA